MRTLARFVGAAILALVMASCAGGHRTAVAHPATAGVLAPAVAIRTDRFAAQRLNLDPSALDDEIRLVRLDGSAACFDVLMRGLGEEVQTGSDLTMGFGGRRRSEAEAIDLTRARDDVFLTAPPDVRLPPTQVIARPVAQSVAQGTEYVERDTGRTAMQCVEQSDDGECLRYEEQSITETVGVAVDHRVLVSRAILCFDHGGRITPQTSAVDLVIGRAHFGFDLTDPAAAGAAWPDHPIVAPGYELLLSGAQRTAGGEREERALALPSDLSPIPVRPMRLTRADGAPLFAVDASGTLEVQGRAGAGRIEAGVMRNAAGLPILALDRDGGVYLLDAEHQRLVEAARVSEGRLVDASGKTLWVDRQGRPERQRPNARPERAEARVSPRLRTREDRVVAALLVMLAERDIAWR